MIKKELVITKKAKMKNVIIVVALAILVIVLSLTGGCASSRFTITEFDKDGNVVSISKITSKVAGARKLTDVDVNIKKGKVKIGSSEGSAGDLAEAILNLSKKIP